MTGTGRRLDGRHLLITGAASGIGRATAELAVADGAQVVLLDKQESVNEVAAGIGSRAIVADLADSSTIRPAVTAAVDHLGALDGLINVAGVQFAELIEDVSEQSLNTTLAVNLIAPYLLCQAAVEHLRASGRGSIVNVASGAALLPTGPTSTAYAASKGGLVSFSRTLAIELAPDVRVNAVCPGLTDTPMVADLLGDGRAIADSPVVRRYAMRRAAQPAEIAAAIVFLASDDASYVTGSTLAADGGRTFH
jgi:NAD(P)-dependent dehydrogenase (short-subunit alcohol dehydrogenase family)